MDYPTLVGSTGVTLLLLAFFLNLFRFMDTRSYPYLFMNLVGGALACYSSHLIGFVPFVVLEGTWAAVAGVALVNRVQGRSDEEAI
jgi:hypothetical protein